MRSRIQNFFAGRNGTDDLGKFLSVLVIVLIILSAFLGNIFTYFAFLLMIYEVFRMCSKNLYKRSQENETYTRLKSKVTGLFGGQRRHFDQRKTYRFYKCPSCRQELRVPRGKGTVIVTCPKCHTRFEKKS